MVVALRAVRVLLPWGVLTEPQGRAGRSGSLWEPFFWRLIASKTFESAPSASGALHAARLSEIRLAESSPACGVMISKLGLPRESTIVAIVRNGKVVMPAGDVSLYGGDEVMVLAMVDCEDEVRKVLIG